MATIAPVIPIPSQPRPEDAPALSAEGIACIAQAMRKRGVTPQMLRPHPALRKFIPALIAARGTP